ncbi:MAG TPA: glycosyltransferase family protein [Methanocella sp.]
MKPVVVIIVQARMSSTRLPGKVLMDIEGKPMLQHIIERLKTCRNADRIVVATSDSAQDRAIVELAERCGAGSYAGSLEDVLDRYYQAAKKYGADVVVRITADCPVIDPELVDRVIKEYLDHKDSYDYVSLGTPNRYPDGLDTELVSFKALEKAWKEAKLASEREHVMPYIWKNPTIFRIGGVPAENDLSFLRWTVDEDRDLRFIREVYRALYHDGRIFTTADILDLLSERPELLKINQDITRNEGYLKSLREDKIVK